MKLCPKCNSKLPDEALFCANCGEKVADISTCPSCGKPVARGSKYCMFCGVDVNNPSQTAQPVKPKEKHTGRNIAIFLFLMLVAAAAAGYVYYGYTQEQARIAQEKLDREQAIADSLEEVEYEARLKAEQAKAEEQHRLEELGVFINSLYAYRGEYRNKIVKFYTRELRAAYNDWEPTQELEGPQALLFEKKWDEGCGTWVLVRNFKKEIIDGTSPNDSIAEIAVDVTFDLYSAYDDEPFMESDSHKDVFKLKYESGEWKIDDLIRDGKSSKQKYRNGSSDFGREIC